MVERGETSVNDIFVLKRYRRGVESHEIVEIGDICKLQIDSEEELAWSEITRDCGERGGFCTVNDQLSLKRYWHGPKSQEFGERGRLLLTIDCL